MPSTVPPAAQSVLEKLAAYHGKPATVALLREPVPFGFLSLDDKRALAQIR